MTIDLDQFERLSDARLHSGLTPEVLDEIVGRYELELPGAHRRVLCATNGIEAYAGYVRLFGLVTNDESVDAIAWNAPEYWKFAWAGRCSDYWCFAETAWGDQYAYSAASLRASGDETVYFLDALSMTAEVVASSFSEFLAREFLRTARAPYDDRLVEARKKFGGIRSDTHLIYMPSVLLGGEDEIENVRTLNARAAMIVNGDIAVQLDYESHGRAVKLVEQYEDSQGRARLRLVWV